MKMGFEVDGDIAKIMSDEVRLGQIAVSSAMRSVGREVQLGWRAQITGAGLGSRLANSIRMQVYPQGRPSLNAAALVYTNADEIISAHEDGALIRSQNGFWLAIPLPAAGRGPQNRKLTPGEWEQRRGIRLRFVYRGNGRALLVADGRLSKKGLGVQSRSKTGRNASTVPIFVLVAQVRLPKRLSLLAQSEAIAARVPGRIVSQWG
jgi:hypothetical protein